MKNQALTLMSSLANSPVRTLNLLVLYEAYAVSRFKIHLSCLT